MNQVERIGRFEVQERLRANSFAIVYRGRDPFDGRRVQIKFCVATDESIRQRFLAAAERASTLRHPNIASVYEFGSGDSKPYLVEEAFSDETLSDLLARGEPVEDVLKLYYLVQVARGLQHAHGKRVLHRELRPASVLLDRSGATKIADFGTARLASSFAQLGNGAHRWPAVGWLLPELLLGLDLDDRSDIYGFGAVAFELLTGRAPFVAESLAELVPQILETEPRPLGVHWPECPPELDRLILRCLARDPRQRFESMEAVVDALDEIVPVTEPADVFEEEKTVVIEDAQTIYLSDLDQSQSTAEPAPLVEPPIGEPITAEQPVVSPREPSVDWSAVAAGAWRGVVGSGRRLGSGLGTVWRWVGSNGSAFQKRPATGVRSRRLRTVGMVMGALLLSGVVGWSVVRAPEREVVDLPTVAPSLPIASIEIENGLLVVEARPWGEVTRVVGEDGEPVDLPSESFTPLPLELAPGRYEVEISRPDLDLVETCTVDVESAQSVVCETQLAALEPADLFKELGWWQ